MKSLGKWLWRHKRISVILIIAVAVLTFSIIRAQTSSRDVYNYTTVQKQSIKSVVSASGIINAKSNSNLRFATSGKITSLNVGKGDTVSAGTVLATLDMTAQSIALQQAQNTLRGTQAAVDKIVDDTHQYQYGNQTAPGAETYTLRQNRTAAEVTRDNAYDNIKAAQRSFNDAVITAPFDGTITAVNFVVGQNASAADTIVTESDFSKLYFEADVDETDLGKIRLGQRADITLNSYGNRLFSGPVAEINPTTRTTTNGATVITVKIDLTGSGITPVVGLNGQADIVTAEQPNVLIVSQEAVRSDSSVVARDQTGLHPVKVTTGVKSDTDVEITSGLKEGETIITNPPPPDRPLNRPNPVNRFFGRLIPRGPRG